MTDPRRITWQTRFRGPEVYLPVVLIEGVPRVLVPSGAAVTETVSSGGSLDSAWWPGTGTLVQTLPDGAVDTYDLDPVRDVLDARVVWSWRVSPKPLEGTVDVGALTLVCEGRGGVMTADLSGPEARATQTLAADVSATDTSIAVTSLTGVPTAGIAYVGREAVIYSARSFGPPASVDLGTPPTARRGAFGSRPVVHTTSPVHPPVVSFTLPRWWQGRRAAVFIAEKRGTQLVDPTLVYLGTVGAGVRLTNGLTQWQVPLDPITEAFARRVATRTVSVSGLQFGETDSPVQPIQAEVDGFRFTRYATWPELIRAWNAGGFGYSLALEGGHLVARRASSRTGVPVRAVWDSTPWAYFDFDSSHYWRSQDVVPRASVVMNGLVFFSAADIAEVPSTLEYGVSDPDVGTSRFALSCDTRDTKGFFAEIRDRDSTANTLTLRALLPGYRAVDDTYGSEMAARALVVEPTAARIGISARGETALGALRALLVAADALDGGGWHDESVDWEHLAAEFRRTLLGQIPQRRHYRVAGDDTLLGTLAQEFLLRGMHMVLRHGRISGVRLAQFSRTERVSRTIGETDALQGTDAEVTDGYTPTASSVKFLLPDGTTYQFTDATFQQDFGEGATIECKALAALPVDSDVPTLLAPLSQVAQQLLGVMGEPQRFVKMTLGPSFLDLAPGDLVALTHSRIPSWEGTTGITDAVCQVSSVEPSLFGGDAKVVVEMRLSHADLSGYAPEALIAAGGISGAVITADTSTAWGVTGFASSEATSPLDGYEVGDAVMLCEWDSESPATETAHTVLAVDLVAHTMTLDPAPDASWVTLAASAYKVAVRFAPYADVTNGQRAYAFVADPSTALLGGTDPPDRWAA